MNQYVIVRLSDMQVMMTATDAVFAQQLYELLLASGESNRYSYDFGEQEEMRDKHPELIPLNNRCAGRKKKKWNLEEWQQLQKIVEEGGIGAAAKEYNVTPKTIYKWLRTGRG